MTESHLTQDEITLWAEGLLPAARAVHLGYCSECRDAAERERGLFLELANLERLAPSAGFAERVIARLKIREEAGRGGKRR